VRGGAEVRRVRSRRIEGRMIGTWFGVQVHSAHDGGGLCLECLFCDVGMGVVVFGGDKVWERDVLLHWR